MLVHVLHKIQFRWGCNAVQQLLGMAQTAVACRCRHCSLGRAAALSTWQTFMCQLQYCKVVWRLPFSTEGQGLTGASGSLDVLAAVLQGAPALAQCRKGGTHRGK